MDPTNEDKPTRIDDDLGIEIVAEGDYTSGDDSLIGSIDIQIESDLEVQIIAERD